MREWGVVGWVVGEGAGWLRERGVNRWVMVKGLGGLRGTWGGWVCGGREGSRRA
jgi:hypothetical protein